ncbi:F-box/kelch-repeat protein [Raphanus sativus]|uniref:F-box/kelch-repeat protein At1g22040-like n=1 Tax=Raphanus sativus TaxID=3726 RepID=A0A6J0JQP6_RAPSA|nr:F-box/kelch-repeat protein At1g22040-like [Raphanus sativus]XP_018437371.1 F-box/kelch-repeat protein At1g22040-like [Raphanus sativus]KAJ4889622.1 F-box/kelch-repeat protein [Raphanus sativus]
MGSVISLSCSKKKSTTQDKDFSNKTFKISKTCSLNDQDSYYRLFPNLPDELSIQILARLPRICYSNVRLVSRRWRSAVSTSELFTLRKQLGKTEEWLYVLTKGQDDNLSWYALDPVSTRWQRLPPLPVIVYEEESTTSNKLVEIATSLLGRKEVSEPEETPFCGCAIGSIDGCLYVLGGLSRSKTVSSVWRFDPVLNSWSEVSSMLANRANSKIGVLDKKLYVVGGVESRRGRLYPLQTAEVYDPETDVWSEVPDMPFSKAQLLPSDEFLADMLKPIATGMTCYNGRLCVTQSLYSCPFFYDAGGNVYDPETNLWGDMPSGMGKGWPARQAGTKLSVVVGAELYGFDPSSSSVEDGRVKVYDQEEDTWKVVIGEVPVYDETDSKSSYLFAGFHGKLHFITRDSNCNVTVLRADVNEIPGSSLSSISKPVLGACSLKEKDNVDNKSDSDIWKVIASKDLGAAELFSCQVIDI